MKYAALFFSRQTRTMVHHPSALLLSAFHPFVWMVLFGSLFHSVTALRGFDSASYVQYLAPGVAVMSAVFGTSYSGLGILGDIHSGLLDRFLATPVSRAAIVFGPLLSATVQALFQATIIVITALGMGARPRGGIEGIVVVFVAVALLGGVVASISHSVALLTRTQRTLISVVNFISLPLVFLSSMMMTRDLMPAWMRAVANGNPVDWAVTVSRVGFNRGIGMDILKPLLLLLSLTVLGWCLTVRCLIRYQEEG